MSLTKIQNRIERWESLHNNNIVCNKPIFFVSDSKGFQLKEAHRQLGCNVNIQFICKSGEGIQSTILRDQLLDQLDKIDKQAHPVIIIWLGTCNLTHKKNQFVTIHSNITDRVTIAAGFAQTLKEEIHTKCPKASVIFLDCPTYSIEEYN